MPFIDSITFRLLVLLLVLSIPLFVVNAYRRRKNSVKLDEDEFRIWSSGRFDKYELKSFLVRGDFNTTFEAIDPDRNKVVAVRILSKEYCSRKSMVDQFSLKGEMLKILSETFKEGQFIKNVKFGATVFRGDVRPYIVSDYVAGASLSEVLKVRGRLSPRDTFAVLERIAMGVSSAHSQNMWIREFSPRNVLLSLDASGKLLVLIANVGLPFKDLPSEKAKSDKFGYYSPEDRRNGYIDERSDVFALAALAFRMLEGYDFPGSLDKVRLSGASQILASALSDDPVSRPSSVRAWIESLSSLNQSVAGQKDIVWNSLLSKIVKGRSKRRVVRGSPEVPVEDGTIPRYREQREERESRKGFLEWVRLHFGEGLVYAFVFWLFQKALTLLDPKKMWTTATIAIIGLAVLIWWFLIPKSGDITIYVIELSKTDTELAEIPITLEAFDVKTNAPVQNIVFKSEEFGKSEGGRASWQTNSGGFLAVHFQGRYDPENTYLQITAQSSEEYLKEGPASVVRLDSLPEDVRLYLRPVRKGTFIFTIEDANHLLTPGNVPSDHYRLELRASDARGLPSKNSVFSIEATQIPSGGEGMWQLANQPLRLKQPRTLAYAVADSTRIRVHITPEGGGTQFEYDVTPKEILIVASKPRQPLNATLVGSSGTHPYTYTFTLRDDKEAPVVGVKVYLNDVLLGTTNINGRVQSSGNDVNGFWNSEPKLKFDLTPYSTSMGWSKEYTVPKSEEFEIVIHLQDILNQ